MLISHNALSIAQRMVQEDGAQPGKGLNFLKAILYFGIAPIALFTVITGLVLLANTKKSKTSAIDQIL